MDCPQCGHENPSEELTCVECGSDLAKTGEDLEKAPSQGFLDSLEKTGEEADIMPRAPILDFLLGREGTTDASLFTSTVSGLLATVIWYYVFPVPLFQPSFFYDIFVNRGALPYFITWFTFAALIILFTKMAKLMIQKKAMKLNFIPPDVQSITGESAKNLIRDIKQIVPRPQKKIMANRTVLGLHQFRNTGSIEQVSNILSYQAEIDLGSLDASYTMVNTFIWAVPILGFLGTVIGIGSAIGGFSGVIKEAIELEAIKDALQVVTGGLATAFDTTLLGLVGAMILMFIATPLRKMEEEFLCDIEIFTIENLLNKMKGKGGAGAEEEAEAITDKSTANRFKRMMENAVDECIGKLETSFISWKGGFSQVLNLMTSQTQDISEEFSAINPIVGAFQESMNSFTSNITKLSGEQTTMMETFAGEIKNVQPMVKNLTIISTNLAEERQIFIDQVDDWIINFDKSGQNILGMLGKNNQQQNQSIQAIAKDFGQHGQAMLGTLEDSNKQQNQSIQTIAEDFGQHGQAMLGKLEDSNQQQNQSVQAIAENFGQHGQAMLGKLEDSNQQQNQSVQAIAENFGQHGQAMLGKLEDSNQQQNQSVQAIAENFGQHGQEFLGKLETHNQQQNQSVQAIADGFEQQGQGFLGKLEERSQQQNQSIQAIADGFEQQGQGFLGKLEERSQQQNQSIQAIIQKLEQQHQVFESEIGKWLQDFETVGKNMFSATESTLQNIEGISDLFIGISDKYEETIHELNSTCDHLVISNNSIKETQDEVRKLIENQESLMTIFNKSFEHQVTSDTIFRETLLGIRQGLESMQTPLKILAKPKKIRLIEE